ncbi:transmembrane protein [Aureobasidium pullulans]|uniref:ER membrane protein complex subunit 3 n=1 Tax=Aureobasidium pullulans TaxID=5580 RepID=A0A4V4JHF7_AURPU|nr:transmembrane protein [Aureobasidium pullulans]THX58546.1 transmembrane protein [Aureobasidium pullulans]THX74872.1 transmembrane protein [Aureobasidium pullulans]THY82070.1 transmembrane protein [Aureobasidium pullulans]
MRRSCGESVQPVRIRFLYSTTRRPHQQLHHFSNMSSNMAEPVVQTIYRDPALFYWILLPITVVMVLTGILRHYLSTLLQSAPKQQAINVLRQQRSLMRGVNLRNNYQQLSPASFAARKAYMIQAYKDGTFLAEPEMRGQPKGNPMSDPAAMEGMMGMMKGQVAMMVPQSLIMGWINAFFSGYVIMKLPFPLTPQFKSMLQSGVGTKDLDVRWVSSLSWYFLTLFGLQPVYNFILGSNNAASQVTQQMAQAQMGVNPMGGQDPDKDFQNEAENLEVLEHHCLLDGVEDRLLSSVA